MGEVLLLEKIEEALAEPPPAVEISRYDDLAELSVRAIGLVEKSRERINAMKANVAKVRKHEDHARLFADFWPELAAHLTKAIDEREGLIKKARHRVIDGAKVRALKDMLRAQLIEEHNAYVQIFYLFKADADDLAEDTRGTGECLGSAADVDAFFDRILPKE
jgi:hypothetical protein